MSIESAVTLYGFLFGPVSVERVCEGEGSVVIRVSTNREAMLIRVTPSGFMRVGKIEKLKARKDSK